MQLREGSPEKAGIRAVTIERLRERAEAWVAQGDNPAMVLLAARRGVIFFHEAFGKQGPEENAPALGVEAIFPLASLTKPITATAVLILVEEGKVGLNRPVQEYLPEFVGEGKDKVMLHHLLTHSSGVNDEAIVEVMENSSDSLEIPELPENQDAFVHRFLSFTYPTPLGFDPGEKMGYSDLGIYMAGEIIRRVSGMSLAQFAQERIFEPLEMPDSFYILPESHWSRVVRRPDDAPAGDRHQPDWMERPSPSSGVYSTALDAAKFGHMFLNRGEYGEQRVLSPASVAAMTRNQIPGVSAKMLDIVFPEASWGLGWSVGHPYKGRFYGEAMPSPSYFSHGGYGGVELWVDPAYEIVGVYFSVALKADETDFARHNADLFMNMVTAGVEQSDSKPTSVLQPAKPRSLAPGSPRNAGVSAERIARVIENGNHLVERGIHASLVMLAARQGVVFLQEALGKFGSEPDAPSLTEDAVFPLASISKPITATAIMILVEEGLLGLNRKVIDYLPEFSGKGSDKVLVRNLLTHTSGLRDEALIEHAHSEKGDARAPAVITIESQEQYVDLRIDAPMQAPINSEMVYADFNYDLLGIIVERVSGIGLPDFTRDRIFEPLGMQNTSFELTPELEARLVARAEDAPFAKELASWAKLTLGSMGAVSSAGDMALFGQMFLNRGSYKGIRILSQASIAAMTRNQVPGIPAVFNNETFPEAEWGLGWSIKGGKNAWVWAETLLSGQSYCHGGTGGVMLWIDPVYELVALFFSTYARLGPSERAIIGSDLYINSLIASISEG